MASIDGHIHVTTAYWINQPYRFMPLSFLGAGLISFGNTTVDRFMLAFSKTFACSAIPDKAGMLGSKILK